MSRSPGGGPARETLEGEVGFFGGPCVEIKRDDGRHIYPDTLVSNRLRDNIGKRVRITIEVLPETPTVGRTSSEVPSSDCTAAEIAYARDADKLRVDKDGLGWVDRNWLEQWRRRVSSEGGQR